MVGMGWTRVALVGLAVAALGCDSIPLRTADTHSEVISTRREVVRSDAVRVQSRVDNTLLVIRARQGCDLVEKNRVQLTEIMEEDEDLTEEIVVLVLGAIPAGIGTGLLVDASAVYDNDRNSRLYNSVGQTGAYAAGGVLVGVGALFIIPGLGRMFQVAAAGEEIVSEVEEDGPIVQENVPCDGGEGRGIRTTVTLKVGTSAISTPGTDDEGELRIDLAEAIPRDALEHASVVEVYVAKQLVGEIDTQPILDEQTQRNRQSEETLWQRADPAACASSPSDDERACAAVREYLHAFPDGLHADAAREALREHEARPAGDGSQIAVDPDTQRAAAIATEVAKRTPPNACTKTCSEVCADQLKDAPAAEADACAAACREEVCR